MKVGEAMRQAYVVETDISLPVAARLMTANNIGGILFVSNDKLKGIITESDLLKHFGKKGKISEAMSKNVITIESKADLIDAYKLMKENKIKKLPVVDKELLGIISLNDIAANAEELGEEFYFE